MGDQHRFARHHPTTSRSKSDSARSRVTRLSFYTSWIRANMGQGPHPGRPFVIPQTSPPSLPLMSGGGGSGNGDGTASSTTKANERRAVIDTTTMTAAAAAAEGESSQTSKAPTKSILKPASATVTNDAAAARFDAEYGNEIWSGPTHVEAAELTAGSMISVNEAEGGEEKQPDPSEKSDATEATGPAGTDDGGAK
ncbi:hypothetical protein PG985_011014 [Apiospora marii]|uniref:uncharacterized protein n=1 Tax=Apiospora marii TaxID=335849 RepID=UPI00312E4E6E